jgi:hypothetical protein
VAGMKCQNPDCGAYLFNEGKRFKKDCPMCGSKMMEVKQRNHGLYHKAPKEVKA